MENELRHLLHPRREKTSDDFARIFTLSQELSSADVERSNRAKIEDAEFLQVVLKEYESLRSECMYSANNRVQVLMLGVAAVGAVIGGTLAIEDPKGRPLLIIFMFSILVPLIVSFITLVWISEAVRAHRAGSHIAREIESRVNQRLNRLALSWETSLWLERYPRDARGGPSMMALGILNFISLASPCMPIAIATGVRFQVEHYAVNFLVPYFVILPCLGVYCWRLRHRLDNDNVISSRWPANYSAGAVDPLWLSFTENARKKIEHAGRKIISVLTRGSRS